MNGRHSVAPAADARAHASDPRFNAPPTISRLHGDARTRVLAGRAEAYRRSHLASYSEDRRAVSAVQPFAWARSLERMLLPSITVAAGMLLVTMLFRVAWVGLRALFAVVL